jgi:hypothetical protein
MGEAVEPRPRFRATVIGTLLGGAAVTTAVEVPADGSIVVLRLIDDDLYAVALAAPHVAHMVTAVRSGEISYVSAEHSRYGHVLLGVRPHEFGVDVSPGPAFPYPLALYLELPIGLVCEVVLDSHQAAELVRHLDEGLRLIGPPALGE